MDSTYLLGNGLTFMQYLASVAFLISLSKTLIWNKIVIPVSNSLNLPELVVNELNKNISQFFLPNSLFLFELSLLYVKIPEASKQRSR